MASSTETGRNDPCPCGSGKKYKRCCLGTAQDPESAPKNTLPTLIVMGLGLVLALVVFVTSGAGNSGLILVVAGLIAGGTYVFTNMPPPNSNSGSPGGINFGS